MIIRFPRPRPVPAKDPQAPEMKIPFLVWVLTFWSVVASSIAVAGFGAIAAHLLAK